MNTCIFLTTRYGSTRLPRKALLEINGKTVTGILIERLKKTNIPIIMTCPDTPEDKKYLKPIAERNAVGFFMSESENVILRHFQCCKENDIGYVILSEGDDWLVTPETINAVYYKAKELRFKKAIRTEGLPFGMNIIAYPRENLENVDFSSDTNWGVHVTKDAYVLKFNYDRPFLLSMDYPEDFEVMQNVYLNCKRNEFVGGIVKYLDKHPEIAEINQKRGK